MASGDGKISLVASEEVKPSAKQKGRGSLSLANHKKSVSCGRTIHSKGPKVSKERSESSLAASAEAKPFVKIEEDRQSFPCQPQEIRFLWKDHSQQRTEGFQRAIGKSFGRLRRGETLRNRKAKRETFPCPPKKSVICSRFRTSAPKVSKGRSESPLVAPAGAKPPVFARMQYATCKNNEATYFVNGLEKPSRFATAVFIYENSARLSKNPGEASEGPQPLRLSFVSAGSAGGAGR